MPAIVPHHTTAEVARLLHRPYYCLFHLIRTGRMPPPVKDGSGRFCWTEADIERARAALALSEGAANAR